MNHEGAEGLLAPYALDALDADEAAEVAAHLQDCPRCQQQLAELRVVTSAIGGAGGTAPDQIWGRIASKLDGPSERPSLMRVQGMAPPSELSRPHRARSWSLRGAALAAAAAITVLALDVSHLDARVGHLQDAMSKVGIAQAADAAAVNPHNREVHLRSASGPLTAEAVLTPGGQAYFVSSDLPALPTGHTYQLWGLAGSRPVSLGLLGKAISPSAFKFDKDIKALMITAEPAGGVVAPTSAVLVQARL